MICVCENQYNFDGFLLHPKIILTLSYDDKYGACVFINTRTLVEIRLISSKILKPS